MATPQLKGTSRVPEVPGKTPPSAVHSVEKGYVFVAEESRSAAKTGKASRLAEKTVTAHLEKELRLGETVTPSRARSILAVALEKADQAVKDYAAKNPAEAARVDLSVAIVAKDASRGSVLV